MSPRGFSPSRIDGNQRAVIEALTRLGCFVQSLSAVGAGCPDLLVGYRGQWILAEIKDGDKSPSRRELTEAEKSWHKRAKADGLPIETWESAEQAVCAVIGQEAQK